MIRRPAWLVCLTVACIAASAAEPADQAARRERLDQRPRLIFAHYMVCYRIGMGAIAPSYARSRAAKLRPDATAIESAFGGRGRGVPLLPDELERLDLQASVDLEMRRAMRAGIDGFAYDVLPLPEAEAFAYLDAMFKVAEEKDYPFYLTFCLDNAARNPGVIEYLLTRHGDSPKLARRDGKVLFFGYNSVFTGMEGATRRFAERHPELAGQEIGTLPSFRATPEGWRLYREGYRDLETRFNTPMYFQFNIGAFFHGQQGKLPPGTPEPTWPEIVGVLAEGFESINAFHTNGDPDSFAAMAKAVRDQGAEWGEPMMYQYQNLLWSVYRYQTQGGDSIDGRWQAARDHGATLLQFTTWNDYTEFTNLAPTSQIRYTLLDLNAYYAAWWKTGQPPPAGHDRVYLLYPPYAHEMEVFPFANRGAWRGPAADTYISVATILTEPATVRLVGRNAEWQAPAGLNWHRVPSSPGPVAVEVVRDGQVAVSLVSPEPITDRPYREDHSLIGYSTEELRHWQADFGDTPPAALHHSDYADDDGDGLPNWFEMVWFGALDDWRTATDAEPEADPDGDGLSNRQEFLARSDPTVAAAYPAGYTWDFFRTVPQRLRFNPERDAFGAPVWYYLHQVAAEAPPKRDGNYWRCERFGWYPGKERQRVVYAAPWNTPGAGEYEHRWTREGDGDDAIESHRFSMTPGTHSLQVIAWQSPIAGRVRLDFALGQGYPLQSHHRDYRDPVTVTVEHARPHRELYREVFQPRDGGTGRVEGIAVAPGDRVYLAIGSDPGTGRHFAVVLNALSVTIEEVEP